MTLTPHFPRINSRVLATLLLVALPALAVAGVVAIGVGQAQLRDSYGRLLGRMAEQTAASVDAFVFRRITDVVTLATVPIVRDASEIASAATLDLKQVNQIDRIWQQHVGLPRKLVAFLIAQRPGFSMRLCGTTPSIAKSLSPTAPDAWPLPQASPATISRAMSAGGGRLPPRAG